MSYDTGNPVPSIDPRDLDDNAENLDNLVNGVDAVYPDRLGVMRKSYAGMEADIEELLDNPNLAAFAALTGVADRLPYFTGAGALSLATLTAKGRELLAGADSAAMRDTLGIPWAGAANATVATDLNAITTTGVFGISSGTLNLPPVAASGSMALSLVFSSTNMQQIVTSRTSDQVYFRRLSGGVWQAWTSFVMAGANSTITSLTGLTTALSIAQGGTGVTTTAALLTALIAAGAYAKTNILGAVTQASGVPTGAILQTVNFTGGWYTKWADGRLEHVRITDHPSVAITTGIGSSFYSITGLPAVAFQTPFISPPLVHTDIIGVATPLHSAQNSIPTTTMGPGVFLMYPLSLTVNVTRYELAIGRWF